MIVDKVFVFISHIKTLAFCINGAKIEVFLRQVGLRIMTKCNKKYIVVISQYILHILQYIAIRFWHIVTILTNIFLCLSI